MSESRFQLLNGIPLPGYVRDGVITSPYQRINRSKRENPMFALKNGGQFNLSFCQQIPFLTVFKTT